MQKTLLTADIPSLSVANVLAAILAATRRPATRVLEELSGHALHIRVTGTGQRDLTKEEMFRLGAPAAVPCCWRTGHLITGTGLIAARTSLTWLPPRLPGDISRALATSTTPAGVLLEPLGVRRSDCRAMPVTPGMHPAVREDEAVISSAVLVVGGRKVAIARERITREFAELLS